ncbi:MAG: MBL fold metallo-hydrolase [Bacteroidia bacterium]|nr:MBL fold metallo-hydrolase [Bacteroidia bacterium]
MNTDKPRHYFSNNEVREEIVQLDNNFFRITYFWGLKPNTLVFTGDEGIMIIDPGQRPMAGRLISAINRICSGKIFYLVNTHPHGDHISGNGEFSREIPVIWHDSLDDFTIKGITKLKNRPFPSCRHFNLFYTMIFNNADIWFIPFPGIHSGKDIMVYFPSWNIIHMGDLLLTQSFPAIGYKVQDYIKFLGILQETFPSRTKFIGGHGHELDMNGLQEYEAMLKNTVEEVRKEMKTCKNLEELQRRDILKEWGIYGEYIGFLTKDYWIESIFRSI